MLDAYGPIAQITAYEPLSLPELQAKTRPILDARH